MSCTSADQFCFDKELALKLRIGALFTILAAGAIGVCFPFLGKTFKALSPERDAFLAIKAFAAGVILSTGFVHVLPDAFDSLTSSCLSENPGAKFPFAGFVSMLGALFTLLLDVTASAYYQRRAEKFSGTASTPEDPPKVAESDNRIHSHAHAHSPAHADQDSLEAGNLKVRQRVVSQVLEAGIVAHSVIIGIALGASQVPCTIRPLFGALTFHQFFEGMGLGGCIAQAGFGNLSVVVMALAFSLTTPLGIAVGIGISSTYNENSSTALIVQGLFDAASSGILIYMALVDLIAADFLGRRMTNNTRLQMWCFASLFLGAGAMSLLAKWA
jgi:zinc transporter 1/2/3